MRLLLYCKLCGGAHAAKGKYFPVAFYDRQEVFEGKGRKKKSLGVLPVLVGYGCWKCVGKHDRAQFIEKHSIKQEPGQRIVHAIRSKIEELKRAVQFKAKRRK
ncbi:MAG: hypothetical protein C4540_04705 [Candidatus Omnitrophota bacterium]|jgi:hypothetical protein|nr:MAG: hypothetical protein C4540_04705 [Candidatus Omnitrophota bacterium]